MSQPGVAVETARMQSKALRLADGARRIAEKVAREAASKRSRRAEKQTAHREFQKHRDGIQTLRNWGRFENGEHEVKDWPF